MKISFVILAYKEIDHVRLNIKNIEALHLDIPYEIIYVDNGSANGIPEMVRELYPHVRIVLNGENLGHPAGNNRGIAQAKGEYVAMINPDIVLRSAEDVYRIINFMDANADVAILGPKLHNPDGSVQNTCYRPYSTYTPIYRRTFIGKFDFAKKDIENHLMTDFDHNETCDVDWLLGAFLVLRNSALKEIGLMDERLFIYFGDYEWCDRARAKGWRVVYFHETTHIFHYHKRESASSRFTITQLFSYFTRLHIKDWITYLRISK